MNWTLQNAGRQYLNLGYKKTSRSRSVDDYLRPWFGDCSSFAERCSYSLWVVLVPSGFLSIIVFSGSILALWSPVWIRYYKDLSLVWGLETSVPRIIVWHHEACTPFIYERRIFNTADISISGVRYIVMKLLWRLMTLLRSMTWTLTKACVTSISTSTYQTRENSGFLSYPRWDNLGRIRISIPGLNPGFAYLVCKKKKKKKKKNLYM